MDNWEKVKLSEIANYINGKAFKPSEWKDKGLPIVRIQNLNTPNSKFNYFDGEVQKKYIIENGSLLFCWSGTPGTSFGAHIWDGKKAVLNQHIFRVDYFQEKINKYFLKYLLNQKLTDFIRQSHGGAGLKHITKKKFENTIVSYPKSIVEQKRIVAKLDGLFAKIDQAIQLLEENIAHTQALMGSVLDEEFGRVEELTTKRDILKNLTTKIGSGSTPRGGQSSYKKSGISLIRSMNVHDCYFKIKNLAFIDEEQADKLKNVEIQENDVLLNITGASVARCCIVDSNYLPARVNQHVSIIRTHESIIPEFLLYFLISPKMKSKLLYDSSGNATREAITKSMIEAIEVPIISIEIQHKLISKIKEYFRINNKIVEAQTEKLTHLKALKSSLLDQAFKGEL